MSMSIHLYRSEHCLGLPVSFLFAAAADSHCLSSTVFPFHARTHTHTAPSQVNPFVYTLNSKKKRPCPDDAIYNARADLRTLVARGNCVLRVYRTGAASASASEKSASDEKSASAAGTCQI